MQNRRKNPWLLLSFVAVVLVSLAVFGFVIWRKGPPPRDYLTNSIGMKLVRVPAGKFLMGSPRDETDRNADEGPQHEVEIASSFYIGVYEVTQEEYQEVMGTNPSVFKSDTPAAVEHVSWDEAVEFCRRLSERPDEKAAGRVYRLPTEAEWEYACRAGTTGPYWSGDKPKPGENPFGLFDTHGNVREWCSDWYDAAYYRNSPATDPQGPKEGVRRVVRGGSRGETDLQCRSAARLGLAPDIRLGNGFRVVLTVSETQP